MNDSNESRWPDLLYDTAGAVAFAAGVIASPYLLYRGFGSGLGQRLGRLPKEARALRERPVWIHAASVGESLSAAPLVARLRTERKDIPVLTSSTTLTGQATAIKELKPDAATLLPLDALHLIDRALRAVRPRCLVLVETEIWPGLIRAAHALEIPVVMVSGTLSERSAARYRWIKPILRAALGRVAAFGMQTDADAQRVMVLGAPKERVKVTGSLKDSRATATPAAPPSLGGLANRPMLIAASTQPGEEEFVVDACTGFWAEHPNLLLVIAPRRPERFDEVAKLVDLTGLRYQRRSAAGGELAAETRVLLLDTIGELRGFLPLASAVFVGGTVAPLGGHNVMEPAAEGKAVAFGPNIDNVAEAANRLIEKGGAEMVRTADDLGRLWWRLLAHPAEAAKMGGYARSAVGEGSDPLGKTWDMVAPYLTLPVPRLASPLSKEA